MDQLYYDMIFHRKSFHVFPKAPPLSPEELLEIENYFPKLLPLDETIQTDIKLVPRERTTCKRGEYCVLIYSEEREHFLQNAGYLGAQLDLWLAGKNIGACWYGMGKTDEPSVRGLPFVIMLAIGKAEKQQFRKDYTKAKRKPLEEIWRDVPDSCEDGATGSSGLPLGLKETVRYAPSACNIQPWRVTCGASRLLLSRVTEKRGMMPRDRAAYYNQIDLGIFMLFLELCLQHENIPFRRELLPKPAEDQAEVPTARYYFETL